MGSVNFDHTRLDRLNQLSTGGVGHRSVSNAIVQSFYRINGRQTQRRGFANANDSTFSCSSGDVNRPGRFVLFRNLSWIITIGPPRQGRAVLGGG